jgi:predicted ATPase/class 3 adenylate cyclase/tetratricopeptide (TPR) repeat protein
MTGLPTGTVTFLFTDVEGSTKLWEDFPSAASAALVRHDEIIESSVASAAGAVVRPRGEGDSRFCVFHRPSDALSAALQIQRRLEAEPWPVPRPIKVRIGVHTGEADLRAGDYYGAAVNRCARIRGIANGGQTLVSRATEEVVDALPRGVTLRDLGAHRLRDVAEPERIFQLCHPDLPDEFGPLHSLDERRNNLPGELSSFIGRESEVHDLKKLVADARLVTLHGAAGCGKTRLALEVADELIGAYADGVWFCDLAPVTDGALVADVVATALGISERSRIEDMEGAGAELRERVLAHLEPRHALVLLDNCEHLVRAAAEFVEDILRACPNVHVLATSREALGVPSEIAWKVPSLSIPDPNNLPDLQELSGFEAFKLFVERARQRRADFAVTAEEAPAIAQICARLDGIPLAIELAAARVKLLSPAQIAARLDERFRLLVGGSRTALERQQTLRATVDWSYEPLSDAERALFRRLGVFAGGFTLESVEAICIGEPVGSFDLLEHMAQLVDKSLVEVEPQGTDVRYRMLETFRQYAREKLLEAGEMAAMRDHHRDHFLGLAETAAPHLDRADQVQWFTRLETEHDNLRAALDWSITGRDTDTALRFVVALWVFWLVRGHISEGRSWCAAALTTVGAEQPASEQAASLLSGALRGASLLAMASYDMRSLLEFLPKWRAAADASGDELHKAYVTVGEGFESFFGGDFATTRVKWEDAYEVGTRIGDPYIRTWTLNMLAQIEGFEGRRERAREMLDDMVSIAREVGDLQAIAYGSLNLSSQARITGDFDAAHRYAAECLEIARKIGDKIVISEALAQMVANARGAGDTARARALIAEGRALRLDSGLMSDVWTFQLARVEEIDGNLDLARALYEEVRDKAPKAGLIGGLPGALEGLARIALAQDRIDDALELARDAARVWVDAGVRTSVPYPIALVARCLARVGRAKRAARLFGASEALRGTFGDVLQEQALRQMSVDIGLARSALSGEEFEEAWQAGGAMSLEEAVAYAMEVHPATAG